jgi:hypothetical protein
MPLEEEEENDDEDGVDDEMGKRERGDGNETLT